MGVGAIEAWCELRELFPWIRLVVFDQLDDLVQEMTSGTWENLGN